LPLRLIADRGELISGLSDSLVKNLGIDASNAPSYRPDLKGLVEFGFNRFQSRLKGFLTKHGLIDKKEHPRIASESFKDACLTKNDIYQLIVREIIFHNRNSWIENHPFAPELSSLDLPCTPINLWKYGISEGLGCIRMRSKEDLWLNCLPTTSASLSQKSISFKSYYWKPANEHDLSLLETLYFQNIKTVNLSYNKNYLEHTFWVHEGRFIQIIPTVNLKADDYFTFDSIQERISSQKRDHKEKVLVEEIDKYLSHKKVVSNAVNSKAQDIEFNDARKGKSDEIKKHRKEVYDDVLKKEDLQKQRLSKSISNEKSLFPEIF
jgi:hypothetical protein